MIEFHLIDLLLKNGPPLRWLGERRDRIPVDDIGLLVVVSSTWLHNAMIKVGVY